MKNLINTSKILIALMAWAMLAPVVSMAQQNPILHESKMIAFDKVGTNGSEKIDPPPPPILSEGETTLTKISFYPNPCKDKLTVEFGDNTRIQKVYIYSLVGNLVYETKLAESSAVINTSNFKTGIYILKTENASYRFTKL